MESTARRVARGAAVIALVLMSLATPLKAHAAFAGSDGLIVYVRGGNIWIATGGGTSQHAITTGSWAGGWSGPQWSPNGQRIVASRRISSTNTDIYTFSSTFTNVTHVTTHAKLESDPTWSPDGTKIAFWSDRQGQSHIFWIKSTAPFGAVHQVTTLSFVNGDPDYPVYDSTPAWQLNGVNIVFVRYYENPNGPGASGLVRRNFNGTGAETGLSGVDSWSPNLAPNGTKVAYANCPNCDLPVGPSYINVGNLNGSGTTHVKTYTPDTDFLRYVAWAPSGTKLLYSFQSADGVRVLNANGSSDHVLIASGKDADWQKV